MDCSGRVAIVTGGASGIGAATAREFALEGASVTVFDVNADSGESAVASMRSGGLIARFQHLDVADADACRAAVMEVVAASGRLDYLVNSAVSFISKGVDATTAEWERSLGVNVRGCANMVQACHGPMKAAGAGTA